MPFRALVILKTMDAERQRFTDASPHGGERFVQCRELQYVIQIEMAMGKTSFKFPQSSPNLNIHNF